MQISHNGSKRRLIAVIGVGSAGMFLYNEKNDIVYLNGQGYIAPANNDSRYAILEDVLVEDSNRVGVYEGDSITLKF